MKYKRKTFKNSLLKSFRKDIHKLTKGEMEWEAMYHIKMFRSTYKEAETDTDQMLIDDLVKAIYDGFDEDSDDGVYQIVVPVYFSDDNDGDIVYDYEAMQDEFTAQMNNLLRPF